MSEGLTLENNTWGIRLVCLQLLPVLKNNRFLGCTKVNLLEREIEIDNLPSTEFTTFNMRHGLMLLWFTDLMNVTEKVTIHRPNVSTLLFSAFIRGDLNAATRGPFI